MDDYYELLGISPHASCEQIRRAYRRSVVVKHRRSIWSFRSELERAEVALAVLSDPVERERYDRLRELSVQKRSGDRQKRQARELKIRANYGERLAREARARGAAAGHEHAGKLARLEHEIDVRAKRALLAQRRARLWQNTLRTAFILALLLGVFWLWPGPG